ncbi:hypothetical protein [Streptomyces sp. NPDC059928]|uniref:hypothetical protein n=1 Tax=unclassified Streptomyces TaxID=2593676 RepID=UPI00364818DB
MSPWEIALLAAGAAVAGGLPVAWFTRPMKIKTPTDAQSPAAALLTMVADATEKQRQQEVRRPVYLEFLVRVEAALGTAGPTSASALEERRAVSSALDAMELVGPADVIETARHLASLAQHDDSRSYSEVEQAKTAFLASARGALGSPAGAISGG